MTYYLFGIFALVAIAWLVQSGIAGHRAAMLQRHRLLDEARGLLREPRIAFAADEFPIVTGRIEDGRKITIELIADTMVTRRLPQLWLKVTLAEEEARDRPSLGALARPAGSEYYSVVHGFAEWMAPPEMNMPFLVRGDGRVTAQQAAIVNGYFQTLFADPQVKEAVITPKATRLIYQASQGSRAAHMFLRQAQFSLDTVAAGTIERTIVLASGLSGVLTEPARTSASQAA